MNFKVRGHIVQKVEATWRKKESNLLKKTDKLPQKQHAKEQSSDMQRIDSILRHVKTDSYTKDCVG